MAQFNNERLRNLRIGIESYTEEELVLDVVGDVSIGGSVFDSNGSFGQTNYVLTSTQNGILWQALTGDGSFPIISGININQSSENKSYNIPFVPIGSGQTATAYVEPSNLTYNPFTDNLGIGTGNPTKKLHILGDFLVAAGSSTGQYITQKAYELSSGTLSWEGSAGQLFSITNNLTTGSIFSVNDVSGIPSIDVNADGTVALTPYADGNVGIATTRPTSRLHVVGDTLITGIVTANIFSLANHVQGSISTTTTTVNPTVILSGISTTIYRSIDYSIQVSQGTNYQVTNISALHNGTLAFNNEYGTVYNNIRISTFDVTISSGNMQLVSVASTSSLVDYKIKYTATKI